MRARHTFGEYAKRNRILKEMGYESYPAYLASPLWARIRVDVLNLCRSRCEMCGERANQVHHNRYSEANLKGESIDGMIGTCGKCHKGVEFHRDGSKASPGMVRGHVKSRQGQKPITKKQKKSKKRRRRTLFEMRRDREFHEKMCDR